MSNEILTILTGALPISEVRGAIPVGIGLFGFSPLKAYLLGVIGNLLPVLPALLIFYGLSDFLMSKHYFFNRFFTWLFQYTRNKHQQKFNYHHHQHWRPFLEFLALFLFVAVPLPFTGAWSGVVAAFVFGIPIWRAALAIGSGVLVSGLITLLIVLGFIALPF